MTSTVTQTDYQKIRDKLANRYWRLNNLYYIKDKSGKKVKFRFNPSQEQLYQDLHYFNVILKARQLGFTTLAMIFFLDACLFNSNHSAGVIAHTQNDANDLFENKIKFAYDNLPSWLRGQLPATSDSVRKLAFSNGSQIYTGVSLRSGTLQKLLVSEFGKISAQAPLKAKEIKTGALNTIEAGQQIWVESTAEGKVGEFYKLTETARKLTDTGKELARLEPKFHFFPWFKNDEYAAQPEEVEDYIITDELEKYFAELENEGIKLSQEQKVWYAIKSETQGDDMAQEYPSTPEEAFQGSLQGAYYTKQMRHLRKNGHIRRVAYDERFPVITWWDLGLNDMMTIWFYQYVNGEHHFIDYHESAGEGWNYYAQMLKDKGYNYLFHAFPHDGNKRVRTGEVVRDKDMAIKAGVRPVKITKRTDSTHQEVVAVCAPLLKTCHFDAAKCEKGLIHLDNYRRRWSKADGMFLKEPEHDEASHGADGYRTFAANESKIKGWVMPEASPSRPSRARPLNAGWAAS